MMTVSEIIRNAGGATRIARESQNSRKPVKRGTVHHWRFRGIDEVHWPLLMRLIPDLTVQQIYDANRELERRRPSRRRRAEYMSAA